MPLNIEEVTEEIKTYLEKNEDRNTMIWNPLNEAKTEHKKNSKTSNLILYLKKWEKVDGANPKLVEGKKDQRGNKWNRN